MASFSERMDLAPESKAELIELVPAYLRGALWTKVIEPATYIDRDHRYKVGGGCIGVKEFIEEISYIRCQNLPDDYQDSWHCVGILKGQLLELNWNEYYDALEWLAKAVLEYSRRLSSPEEFGDFLEGTNKVLTRANVGWQLSESAEFERRRSSETTKIESLALESALPYAATQDHLLKARKYLNARPCDTADSIKESVSGVESRGRIAFPKTATLGDVISALKRRSDAPQGLVGVLDKYYAFANQEPGVRHGGRFPERVTARDADLAYGIALAFVTYLGTFDTQTENGNDNGDLSAGNG